MPGREIISLHIGQAGIQVGESCWELFTKEHNVSSDGFMDESARTLTEHTTFFDETGSGHFVPRCVMVDLEVRAGRAPAQEGGGRGGVRRAAMRGLSRREFIDRFFMRFCI